MGVDLSLARELCAQLRISGLPASVRANKRGAAASAVELANVINRWANATKCGDRLTVFDANASP
jgi:hypothetical protein